jgi:ATP-dependent Clp protease ATP-binding subunit ClpA
VIKNASLNRFTPRARHVLAVAQEEAHRLGRGRVTNEHIVLGLLAEPEGLAAKAIVALGPSLDEVRDAIVAGMPTRKRTDADVRFSGPAKKTLQLALRTALQLFHNYIGTEHLLLGMLQIDDDPATDALAELGVTYEPTLEWLKQEFTRLTAGKQA